MVLVLVFLALVLSLYSVSQRYIAAMLRVETVRTLQRQRDEGCLHAAGRGLDLLETGFPATAPYACGVTIETSAGPIAFTVTFTREGTDAQGRSTWSVRAAPTGPLESPPPMPAWFTAASPP